MKKYVLIASVILTLAGCSASAPMAEAQNKVVSKEIVSNAVSTFNAQSLIKLEKIKRNTAQMNKVIKYLKTRVGKTPYKYGRSTPRRWDCSGMVRWTYERFGLEIPHSANAQGHLGTRVSKPKLGDIVVFADKGSTDFYHAAIYIGNGKIINAHYGANSTIIQPLTDYKGSQIRFVRVVKTL